MDGGERMMEPALAGAPASALPVLAVLREWGWAVEEVESPGPCPEDADAPPESAPPPREGVRGSEDGEGGVEDGEEGKATEKEETEDEEDGGDEGTTTTTTAAAGPRQAQHVEFDTLFMVASRVPGAGVSVGVVVSASPPTPHPCPRFVRLSPPAGGFRGSLPVSSPRLIPPSHSHLPPSTPSHPPISLPHEGREGKKRPRDERVEVRAAGRRVY